MYGQDIQAISIPKIDLGQRPTHQLGAKRDHQFSQSQGLLFEPVELLQGHGAFWLQGMEARCLKDIAPRALHDQDVVLLQQPARPGWPQFSILALHCQYIQMPTRTEPRVVQTLGQKIRYGTDAQAVELLPQMIGMLHFTQRRPSCFSRLLLAKEPSPHQQIPGDRQCQRSQTVGCQAKEPQRFVSSGDEHATCHYARDRSEQRQEVAHGSARNQWQEQLGRGYFRSPGHAHRCRHQYGDDQHAAQHRAQEPCTEHEHQHQHGRPLGADALEFVGDQRGNSGIIERRTQNIDARDDYDHRLTESTERFCRAEYASQDERQHGTQRRQIRSQPAAGQGE